MSSSEDLAKRIRARIGELRAEIEAHERALAALEGRSGSEQSGANGRTSTVKRPKRVLELVTDEHRKTPSPSAAPSPRRRGRRPVVSADAVFAALRDGNDEAAQIAKEFGVSTATVGHRLKQLEDAGRVSRSGQRRGTRWHTGAGDDTDPAA
jgi:predicted Rossmann fold nucleotide-binding protein DprA/Smf involved in DNA uptake